MLRIVDESYCFALLYRDGGRFKSPFGKRYERLKSVAFRKICLHSRRRRKCNYFLPRDKIGNLCRRSADNSPQRDRSNGKNESDNDVCTERTHIVSIRCFLFLYSSYLQNIFCEGGHRNKEAALKARLLCWIVNTILLLSARDDLVLNISRHHGIVRELEIRHTATFGE